ncbi:SPW repeat protein [Mesorhizobium sp.]|uniref:SPW repeat protein n=1 Tax=Mesorhizobium sp. TaxID=1871066 RepID=UPI000FE34F7C|nr:SPW repeat protein [Mesorhizobium sp.]RWA68537.1 MAG: hypothetical protein EOQ28_24835 [Mesorhizobium sp.]RWB97923.1 MAG: hypothetical protein EOQ57_23290 [Mesorhizobium sp.]RWG80101.1 MAG: hypothetical protein EOQ69_22375 [Mesorhizobium sp.]RWG85028.1 MAG: hypothetical protein EOQ70_18160 [Mesorhizobium sp.]RWK16774.1 MAG: hypothetical protein EOR41_18790 [Mesorhizobium sp.]
MKDQRWQDWFTCAAGFVVFFLPSINISFSGGAMLGDTITWALWIVGSVIVVIALAALANPRRWEEWAELVLGVLLMILPFALGFHDQVALAWTAIGTGAIVAVLSLWALVSDSHNLPHH